MSGDPARTDETKEERMKELELRSLGLRYAIETEDGVSWVVVYVVVEVQGKEPQEEPVLRIHKNFADAAGGSAVLNVLLRPGLRVLGDMMFGVGSRIVACDGGDVS